MPVELRNAPHLVIEDVRPSVNDGRYAVKRVIGDVVRVEATVYRDGHDALSARIRYRPPGSKDWCAAPMTYERDLDRCAGTFVVDRIGRWAFTVEAWTDRFGTWRTDLRKKYDAGQDVHSDLLEGAALIREAAGAAKNGRRLQDAAARVADPDRAQEERVRMALDDGLARLVYRHLPASDLTRPARAFPIVVDREIAACAAWYELFPRSQGTEPGRHGTFADAERRLPELAELGFDVVYLPPIHPIGRINRKGRNNALEAGPDDPGSPWAIGSVDGGHTAIEPQLGTLEDFRRFVAHANELGMEVALDYALQCAPDHPWVKEHPEWFFRRPDGSIRYAENPPKKYQDIYPLDFWNPDFPALWEACRDIFLYWIRQGVKIFRVDNPHTKPFSFWEWVIAEVTREHPDAVFLSEAFTRPARMYGLARLGFSQSYTYFTWRNTPQELRQYLIELTREPVKDFFRPNFFANTPDILHEYLQRGGRPAFRVRLVLAATLSPLYGIYSGFELCENVPVRTGSEEYLDSEKYEIRMRDWNAPGHIKDDIATLNRLRREHAALRRLDNLEFLTSENEQILWYRKSSPPDDLLIAVNMDPFHPQDTMVHVPLAALGLAADVPYEVVDLLSGARYVWQGPRNYVRLDPALQVAHILHIRRPVT